MCQRGSYKKKILIFFASLKSLKKGAAFLILIRIRILQIHQIHVFFGLPDPDPLVRGMDPDPDPAPDPFIIMQK